MSTAASLDRSRQSCTIPDCEGLWHGDHTCTRYLAVMPFSGGDELTVEMVQQDDRPPHIQAFGLNLDGSGLRRRLDTAESAREFAARLRAVAAAIDATAGNLPASS